MKTSLCIILVLAFAGLAHAGIRNGAAAKTVAKTAVKASAPTAAPVVKLTPAQLKAQAESRAYFAKVESGVAEFEGKDAAKNRGNPEVALLHAAASLARSPKRKSADIVAAVQKLAKDPAKLQKFLDGLA